MKNYIKLLLLLTLAFAQTTQSSLYKYTGNNNWQLKPDILTQISVVDANNIWAVNEASDIYKWDGNDWKPVTKQIGSKLTGISAAADGTVWGINHNAGDQIYKFTSAVLDPSPAQLDRTNMPWKQMPGTVLQLSVGSKNNIWGINSSGDIYKMDEEVYFRDNSKNWVKQPAMPGVPRQISAAADGTVWGINNAGDVFQFAGNTWVKKPGNLSYISVGNAHNIMGVNKDAELFKWSDNNWVKQASYAPLTQISIGADGTLWGLDTQRRLAIGKNATGGKDILLKCYMNNNTVYPASGTADDYNRSPGKGCWAKDRCRDLINYYGAVMFPNKTSDERSQLSKIQAYDYSIMIPNKVTGRLEAGNLILENNTLHQCN